MTIEINIVKALNDHAKGGIRTAVVLHAHSLSDIDRYLVAKACAGGTAVTEHIIKITI